MIALEKWIPEKPLSAVYWDGNKERYYVKRFLIENPEKDEEFITDHPDSQLEIISTDYRPVIEIAFYKERNKDQKENEIYELDEFIAVKGITAQGNQLYTEKLKQINLLDPLPYEIAEEDTENPEEENGEKVQPADADKDVSSTKRMLPTASLRMTMMVKDKRNYSIKNLF